jgi:hypothetical protein
LQGELLGDQERPEELVPGPDEGDDHGGQDGRPGQWDGDPGEDLQLRGAVQAGRLEQLLGELHEELAEDEHCGGVDRERQDHAQVGVPELVAADDHHVQGDHQQLEGQQQDEQHGAEHHAPAAELQPGQRVAGQQPDHQGGQQHAAGEDARVEQGAGQVDGLVDVAQVVEGQVGRVRERP